MVPLSAPTLGPMGAAEAVLPHCLCPRTVPRGDLGPGGREPPSLLAGCEATAVLTGHLTGLAWAGKASGTGGKRRVC